MKEKFLAEEKVGFNGVGDAKATDMTKLGWIGFFNGFNLAL
ncbi:hypothetical protein [Streptococcus mutans]|nr:hypothetical protein [Streptococcus mutans]